jgi:hypothetical protein
MVIVDEDINMRSRLAPLVAQPHVYLRVLPRKFGEQPAHFVGRETKFHGS